MLSTPQHFWRNLPGRVLALPAARRCLKDSRKPFRLPAWYVAMIALLAVGPVACSGPEMPELHPVTGKVLWADGQPLAGGSVQLNSPENSMLIINGAIGPDGTFALATVKEGTRVEGVPIGSYHVTLVPPMGEDQMAQPPIRLPEPVSVAPGGNELTLELPAAVRQ